MANVSSVLPQLHPRTPRHALPVDATLLPQLHVQAGPPPRNVAGSSHPTRKKNFVQRATLLSLLLGLAATKCACHDTSNSRICVRCSHVFLPCFQDVICLRATKSLPRVGKSTAGFPHTDKSCLRLVNNLLEVKMSQRGVKNTYSLVTHWQQRTEFRLLPPPLAPSLGGAPEHLRLQRDGTRDLVGLQSPRTPPHSRHCTAEDTLPTAARSHARSARMEQG